MAIFHMFWVNYNMSLTWIKASWGWFPYTFTMIPVRENSEVVIIYPDMLVYQRIKACCNAEHPHGSFQLPWPGGGFDDTVRWLFFGGCGSWFLKGPEPKGHWDWPGMIGMRSSERYSQFFSDHLISFNGERDDQQPHWNLLDKSILQHWFTGSSRRLE